MGKQEHRYIEQLGQDHVALESHPEQPFQDLGYFPLGSREPSKHQAPLWALCMLWLTQASPNCGARGCGVQDSKVRAQRAVWKGKKGLEAQQLWRSFLNLASVFKMPDTGLAGFALTV